jgi:sirohydrochlorin ferrochelatase
MNMRRFALACATLLLIGVWCSTWAQEKAQNTDTTAVKATKQAGMALVIVGHGIPASDFSRDKLRKMMELERQIELAGGEDKVPASVLSEFRALERECRRHPRTPQNDPYNAAVERVAQAIVNSKRFDHVLVAHNEFCGLDVEEAIELAVQQGAKRILVFTTMVIPGGMHSEVDIPMKVARAQNRFPNVQVEYIWPVSKDSIANLILHEVDRHIAKDSK